jgi:hypothetical protein
MMAFQAENGEVIRTAVQRVLVDVMYLDSLTFPTNATGTIREKQHFGGDIPRNVYPKFLCQVFAASFLG